MKHPTHLIALLFNIIVSVSAPAQQQRMIVTPSNPHVGDFIRIGISTNNCYFQPNVNQDGLTHLIDINNTNITILAVSSPIYLPGAPICFDLEKEYYDLGVLPAGDYDLTAYISMFGSLQFPFPANSSPATYANISFNISSLPKIINTNNSLGIVTLILLILLSIFSIFSKKNYNLS